MINLKTCLFCNKPLAKYYDQPAFSRCRACGLILRNPFPDQRELDALYHSSWEEPQYRISETGNVDMRLARQYTKALVSSLKQENLSGQKIVDYGAGKGSLMRAFKECGAETFGIEPYGAEHLRRKGFNVFVSTSEIPEALRFDGAITMDVVEHLREPWVDFEKLYSLLNPGAWICVCTPNPHGLHARLQRSKWREVARPGHILLFEEGTLALMLQQAGFCDFRRLRWQIRHSSNFLKSLAHFLLQACYLDGHLCVLARKL